MLTTRAKSVIFL